MMPTMSQPFLLALQRRLAERNQKGGQRRFCLDVSMVQKQTVLHYQPRRSRAFFKVVVATPNLVAQSRGVPPLPPSHPPTPHTLQEVLGIPSPPLSLPTPEPHPPPNCRRDLLSGW